jgi:hypothetical protein
MAPLGRNESLIYCRIHRPTTNDKPSRTRGRTWSCRDWEPLKITISKGLPPGRRSGCTRLVGVGELAVEGCAGAGLGPGGGGFGFDGGLGDGDEMLTEVVRTKLELVDDGGLLVDWPDGHRREIRLPITACPRIEFPGIDRPWQACCNVCCIACRPRMQVAEHWLPFVKSAVVQPCIGLLYVVMHLLFTSFEATIWKAASESDCADTAVASRARRNKGLSLCRRHACIRAMVK